MAGQSPRPAASDQDIYDRVFSAILDRRLQPGAHLREVELAEMFGVSRTKVRQALAKLIQNGVVELRPNRGAAVAAPSRAQARQVFALRAMLEPAIAARCAMAHGAGADRLRAHVDIEDEARRNGDEAALIRATGEFHLLLGGLLGNPLVDKLLLDLEALTCLSILSYARAESCACLPDEHRAILHAVVAGRPDEARQLMATHLDHVLDDLDLREPRSAAPSLAQALGVPAQRPRLPRKARPAKAAAGT